MCKHVFEEDREFEGLFFRKCKLCGMYASEQSLVDHYVCGKKLELYTREEVKKETKNKKHILYNDRE